MLRQLYAIIYRTNDSVIPRFCRTKNMKLKPPHRADDKYKAFVLAIIPTVIVMYYASRPGILNLFGYLICQLFFGRNTSESIQYEHMVIISVDIAVGFILYWILYRSIVRLT